MSYLYVCGPASAISRSPASGPSSRSVKGGENIRTSNHKNSMNYGLKLIVY